ncbi:GBS Bsp-like repeat-containing protein [Lactococcus insecticola]|uniref:GBS Bsp-like repeat-containing protein n=1 Tax=Pseudolactococcus insecticola TaxID=2709158 RepID=UPI0015570DBF|nr:GBS Bsp-like repeat-containing protein [Lactococcus insecticola]
MTDNVTATLDFSGKVPADVTKNGVYFKIWSESKGQDDVFWYKGVKNASNGYVAMIDAMKHLTSGNVTVQAYTGDKKRLIISDTYANGTIKTASDIQTAINATKSGGTTVLSGIYRLDGSSIYMASNKKVDARNAVFIGSGYMSAVNASNISWNGGTFIRRNDSDPVNRTSSSILVFPIWNSDHLNFTNMSFIHNGIDSHMFDLMGASYVTFSGMTFKGYHPLANSFVTNQLVHTYYAESVQVDFATAASAGGTIFDKIIAPKGGKETGAPSHHITMQNSTFTDYNVWGRPYEKMKNPMGNHNNPNPALNGAPLPGKSKGIGWTHDILVQNIKWNPKVGVPLPSGYKTFMFPGAYNVTLR